jgi:hypothetical protein
VRQAAAEKRTQGTGSVFTASTGDFSRNATDALAPDSTSAKDRDAANGARDGKSGGAVAKRKPQAEPKKKPPLTAHEKALPFSFAGWCIPKGYHREPLPLCSPDGLREPATVEDNLSLSEAKQGTSDSKTQQ